MTTFAFDAGSGADRIQVAGDADFTLSDAELTRSGGGSILLSGVQEASLTGGATGNSIRGNSIFGNTGLGIDLGGDGVTPNDPGDADSGGNNLRNFPLLLAVRADATTRVLGELHGLANTTFTLDFYANQVADVSGHGEGRRYLGFATVATDAAGDADFDLSLPASTNLGEQITATATDPGGNTSEFSAALTATPVVIFTTAAEVEEGSAFTLQLAAGLPLDGTITSWTISWGDGAIETLDGNPATATHMFDDGPAAPLIAAEATDGIDTFSSNTLVVSVTSAPPSATFGNNGPVYEGSAGVVRFSGQGDPSLADRLAGFLYSYDFDNDGTFEIAGSSSATAVVPGSILDDGPGARIVRGRIIDKDGAFADYTTTFTVINVAPSASFSHTGVVNEGSAGGVSFSNQSDPSPGDVAAGFTYSYDFGNDGTFEIIDDASATAILPASLLDDGPGTYKVRGRIKDVDGDSRDYTTQITILNVAPTATLDNDGSVNEGSSGKVRFLNQSDASSADIAAGFTYSYDFDNDGAFELTGITSPQAVVPAVYLDDGPGARTVRGRIIDQDGGFTDYTNVITILGVAPSASLGNNGPVGEGSAVLVGFAEQSDPSTADTNAGFTYSYDFDGDGVFEIEDSTSPQATVLEEYIEDGPGGSGSDNSLIIGGSAGDDTIILTEGNSVTVTNNGADLGTFDPGNRVIVFGGDGNDTIDGSALTTIRVDLSGGGGSDSLYGGTLDDRLDGGDGNDRLFGNDGTDWLLHVSGGNDILDGGLGNDTFSVIPGSTITVVDDGGDDTLDFSTNDEAVEVTLDETSGLASDADGLLIVTGEIENVLGTPYDDTIVTNSLNNLLDGGAGNDLLDGGGGDDTLIGGAGDDTYIKVPGSLDEFHDTGGIDTIDFSQATSAITIDLSLDAGQTQIVDSAGNEVRLFGTIENVIGSAFDDNITGNSAANVLEGLAGDDLLIGGEGNDVLRGGDGDDTLVGSHGDDTLEGGAGNDTYKETPGSTDVITDTGGHDTVDFSLADYGVTVDLSLAGGEVQQVDGQNNQLIINGSIEDAVGSQFDDFFKGSEQDNLILGGGGNDFLLGFGGNDRLHGGDGNDLIIGGEGVDEIEDPGGDNILVTGATIYDNDDAAMIAILEVWSSEAPSVPQLLSEKCPAVAGTWPITRRSWKRAGERKPSFPMTLAC